MLSLAKRRPRDNVIAVSSYWKGSYRHIRNKTFPVDKKVIECKSNGKNLQLGKFKLESLIFSLFYLTPTNMDLYCFIPENN